MAAKSDVNTVSGSSFVRKIFQHNRFPISGSRYAGQYYFWLSIVLVGSWYLYLNLSIPFHADDYSYSMMYGFSRRLESLRDAIISGRNLYQTWGGRIVAAGIGQLALLGKWQTTVFRFLNTCVFLGLNLLLVDFGRSRYWGGSNSTAASINDGRSDYGRPRWMLFLISFYLFWLFVRTLGETTLWLMGSVNYLWILFFILLFLRLSITLYTRNSFPILILHVLMGFFAGCGYESTSLTGLIFFLILFFRQEKGFRRISWQMPGFLAYLAGYILLLVAPGNIIRAEYIGVDETFFSLLVNNIPHYVKLHIFSWEILLLLLVLVLVALKKLGRIDWTTWVFIGAGFFNNGLMLVSPTLPMRSSFASSAFFICAILSLLSNPSLVTRRVLVWILIAFSAISIVLAFSDGISYWEWRVLDKERKSIARAALENDETTVEWPLPSMRFNQRVFERDIKGSSSYWVNEAVANYYGFDAVFGKEPGLEYYYESEPWLSANRDLGDVKLIDISKYCDARRCFLYFRLSANKGSDVNWDNLSFRLTYTYAGALHQRIIGLLPDKFFRNLGAKGIIMTPPHRAEDSYIFVYAIPKEHSAINRIEFSVESGSETYRWSKK